MTFVPLTAPNGNRTWVNPEAVEYVRPTVASEKWPNQAATVIGMASGQMVVVRETDDVVRAALQAE